MRAGKRQRNSFRAAPPKGPERPSADARRTVQRRGAPAGVWLYGIHAVLAAIANPDRKIVRLIATPELISRFDEALTQARTARGGDLPPLEEVDRQTIDNRLAKGAVHQGIAAEAGALPELGVEDICRNPAPRAAVLVLDQVTDPQNVGAILRTAAGLGAIAVLTPERGAPEATGALAKAASGALERVPLVHVVNLRRALETLKTAGFWCVGLDHTADRTLEQVALPERAALVLGAEGNGLRRLTRETCDLLVAIPIGPAVDSLNVSTAAAIALYEWRRQSRLPAVTVPTTR
ncbi:MAG: 23S rRNA (guanosine(2251)-2'-O)-methyltransferase RlmB [Alphaproteobacteria bacterium]|nr:23S rRNA (guanosine(2251)-2'-O)-methyltransferase RlmB [Alphaproteobacteria bacterium]